MVAAQATTMKKAMMSVTMQPMITSQRASGYSPGGDALFDHRGLQVELHPGRDGGADQAHDHGDVAGIAT